MVEGWIKLHRSIRKNWIWEDAQKLKWWLDILLQANHHEKKILLGNELITVERGSFHTSEIKLAERWKVDRKTVRRFLELLEKDSMIFINKSKKGTTLKVRNYEDYQGFSEVEKDNTEDNPKDNSEDNKVPTEGTTGGTDKSQISPNKRDTNNNDKELYKNDKELGEGKEGEEIPSVPSLPSNPTEVERAIINQFGETSYKTWFATCKMDETDKVLKIVTPNNFTKDVINNKYKKHLETLTHKQIIVEEEAQ